MAASSTISDGRNTIRGNWGNKMEFILSVVGFCVGFGNVWRFPSLCYRNGGGAFLIPYLIMLWFVGVPLYFLELAIGQYASLGVVAVWKLSPMFKGIGLTTITAVGVINVYYNMLLTYVLFYLFASMTSQLPWTSCGNPWNTPACKVRVAEQAEVMNSTLNETLGTSDVISFFTANGSEVASSAVTGAMNLSLDVNISKPKSPTEEYFERYVLDISSGMDELGGVRWQLLLCLLLAWIIIYACVAKGIEFSGKVVYFTATFPYVVLFILLIRGLTLPGSSDGLKYYITPQWHHLARAQVWGEAASQIFFSLGPAWGCLIVYGSYNKFNNKCNRDAIISCCICSGTSLLAGAVVFSIIGYMAHELQLPIGEVMNSGPGLAFVAYPEAIATMPGATFWAIIFFFMLLTVGLDSMMAQIEILVVPIIDAFPKLANRKWLVTLSICVVYFILNIPFTTRGGMYLVTLLDWHAATYSFIIICLVENIVIIYGYGYSNVEHDIELMIGTKPNFFYKLCWCVVTPAIIGFILIFNIIVYSPAKYNDYVYPQWANNFGFAIGILPLFFIPGYMIYHYVVHIGSLQNFREALSLPWTGQLAKELLKPASDWGPMMPEHRLAAGHPISEEGSTFLKTEKSRLPPDDTDLLPKV